MLDGREVAGRKAALAMKLPPAGESGAKLSIPGKEKAS